MVPFYTRVRPLWSCFGLADAEFLRPRRQITIREAWKRPRENRVSFSFRVITPRR